VPISSCEALLTSYFDRLPLLIQHTITTTMSTITKRAANRPPTTPPAIAATLDPKESNKSLEQYLHNLKHLPLASTGGVVGDSVEGVVIGGVVIGDTGGTVGGSCMVTAAAPLHTCTTLCVCPRNGWRRRVTGVESGARPPKGESGPDRGRLGSVNTILNGVPSVGRWRVPCLETRSPALHKRGASEEQRSGFAGGAPTTDRPLQLPPSITVPILRSQRN
jgi:hypothetical protein